MQVHVQGRYLQGPCRADIAGHEQRQIIPDHDDPRLFLYRRCTGIFGESKHTHPQLGDRNNVTAEETLRRILEQSGRVASAVHVSTNDVATRTWRPGPSSIIQSKLRDGTLDHRAVGNVHGSQRVLIVISRGQHAGLHLHFFCDRHMHMPCLDVGSTPLYKWGTHPTSQIRQ